MWSRQNACSTAGHWFLNAVGTDRQLGLLVGFFYGAYPLKSCLNSAKGKEFLEGALALPLLSGMV
jgi:hypothetical protein